MLNIRQNLIILVFFALCSSIVFISFDSEFGDNKQFDNDKRNQLNQVNESYFKRADYYVVGLERENFHLFSDELIHNQTSGDLALTKPNGVFFSKDGDPVYYSAKRGYFKTTNTDLHLIESVILRTKEGVINSDDLVYNDKNGLMVVTGNVYSLTKNYDQLYEVRIKSDKMEYSPSLKIANYLGNVKGKIERKRAYEMPVLFRSDRLKFRILEKMADLEGNVYLKKEGVRATALRGEIFLENYNKKLKYFALYDDVIIKETVKPLGKPSFERKAFSEKLEGYAAEGLYVLLGYPKVHQGNDILKGNIIILRENNETIEVDDANTNFRLK